MNKFFIKIKTRLNHSLPGSAAQFRMAPEIRRIPEGDRPARHASVLLLLFPDEGRISLAFIRRTRYDGPHSGQISFPGGISEKSDRDLLHTALRESEEETGINSKDVTILGQLNELKIPISNFIVHPFVGFLDYYPDFKIDPVEVDHLIIVPLSHLMDKGNIAQEIRRFQSESFSVPYYKFNDNKIWGATAMMLSEFLSIIEGLEPDQYLPED